jgi:hypothetical protein
VERRQHQLAAAQVLGSVDEQQRTAAHERLQQRVAAGGDDVGPVGGEQGLHRSGVRDEHHVAAGPRDVGGERAAELPPAALQERDRPGEQPRRLDGLGALRSRGQGHAANVLRKERERGRFDGAACG